MLCLGWIDGSKSDILKLQKLGVTGKMLIRDGCIEYCEATEEIVDKLIKSWTSFWPPAFTIVDEKRNQLPKNLQRYWKMYEPPNNNRDVLTKQRDSRGSLSWVVDYYCRESLPDHKEYWYEASMWDCEVLYWEELKPLTDTGKPEGGS